MLKVGEFSGWNGGEGIPVSLFTASLRTLGQGHLLGVWVGRKGSKVFE